MCIQTAVSAAEREERNISSEKVCFPHLPRSIKCDGVSSSSEEGLADMVGLLQDSRALQALLQKYRDLPSRLSAKPRRKTPQCRVREEYPQRRLEVLGYSFLKFSTARFLHYQLGCRASANQLNDLRERLVGKMLLQKLSLKNFFR